MGRCFIIYLALQSHWLCYYEISRIFQIIIHWSIVLGTYIKNEKDDHENSIYATKTSNTTRWAYAKPTTSFSTHPYIPYDVDFCMSYRKFRVTIQVLKLLDTQFAPSKLGTQYTLMRASSITTLWYSNQYLIMGQLHKKQYFFWKFSFRNCV